MKISVAVVDDNSHRFGQGSLLSRSRHLSTHSSDIAGDNAPANTTLFILCLLEWRVMLTAFDLQFPCGRVKRFLKNNTQNKMRVGAKG